MKTIITVKQYALAVLIAKLIQDEFGGSPEIQQGTGIDGYRVSCACEDENIDHITCFAVGIKAAVGSLFL